MRVMLIMLLVNFAFTAQWCRQCQRDKPKLRRLQNKYDIREVDVDKHPNPTVTMVPTYLVIEGKEVFRTNDISSFERYLSETHKP